MYYMCSGPEECLKAPTLLPLHIFECQQNHYMVSFPPFSHSLLFLHIFACQQKHFSELCKTQIIKVESRKALSSNKERDDSSEQLQQQGKR